MAYQQRQTQPLASAIMGWANNGENQMAAPIMQRLRNTGIMAGTTNRPHAFKIAPAKTVSVMNGKYSCLLKPLFLTH